VAESVVANQKLKLDYLMNARCARAGIHLHLGLAELVFMLRRALYLVRLVYLLLHETATQRLFYCLPHAVNCGRFCFVVPSCLWVSACVRNISGTAARICAKFTRKTCLVACSEEFEDQGQISKIKVTRDKNGIFRPFRRLRSVYV